MTLSLCIRFLYHISQKKKRVAATPTARERVSKSEDSTAVAGRLTETDESYQPSRDVTIVEDLSNLLSSAGLKRVLFSAVLVKMRIGRLQNLGL